jgi:2,4-dienoyl-CoA reductase (NADPH2)
MSIKNIEQTVDDYARSARLAKQAEGYDGVEIMGSGATCSIGFITSRQQRKDIYGGDIHGV